MRYSTFFSEGNKPVVFVAYRVYIENNAFPIIIESWKLHQLLLPRYFLFIMYHVSDI